MRGCLLAGVVVIGAIVVACSVEVTDRKLGDSCDNDGECTSGLSCKQNLVGNQCTSKTCTKTCDDDSTCTAVEAKSKCFAGCGNEKICMRTP